MTAIEDFILDSTSEIATIKTIRTFLGSGKLVIPKINIYCQLKISIQKTLNRIQ